MTMETQPITTTVRRTLTGSPLTRAHDRLIDARPGRQPRPIPWAKFDRGRYPEPALAQALRAQLALAEGEYGAVVGFAKLASALALQGVPFDLVAMATRIPADELRHAEYALRMASLLAGRDAGALDVAVDAQRLRKADPCRWTMAELDALMANVPAVSETLASALLAACRDRATDPVAQALFSSILADEIHHARFGWYYLMWRAPQWTRAERQQVADSVGERVADTERQFWRGRDAAPDWAAAARALGVLDSPGQREAVRTTMERDIVPALDGLGLGASHAWRVRRRGA
jgi:hypothetical protein